MTLSLSHSLTRFSCIFSDTIAIWLTNVPFSQWQRFKVIHVFYFQHNHFATTVRWYKYLQKKKTHINKRNCKSITELFIRYICMNIFYFFFYSHFLFDKNVCCRWLTSFPSRNISERISCVLTSWVKLKYTLIRLDCLNESISNIWRDRRKQKE